MRDDDENEVVVEVDSPEWPGLNATANLLVTTTYLHHSDKDVRLYTVLACIEILAIVSTHVGQNSATYHDLLSPFVYLQLMHLLFIDGVIVRTRCTVGGT